MNPNKKQKPKKELQVLGWRKGLAVYLHDLFLLMSVLLVVFLVVFRLIVVKGPSMKMTFLDGDYLLLLSNVFYHEPQYGDVVVISMDSFDDGKPIIKRVIATEGQIVDIDFQTGTVKVDGEILDEPYINNLTLNEEGMAFPLMVDEGCIFVLGDNRQASKDSRNPAIGMIDTREIIGKAIYLLYPGTDGGEYIRDNNRIGEIE